MNKKGFTLVELLAVTVLLLVVAVITIINVFPTAEKNTLKSFVNEAITISDGAKNMYLDNKLTQNYSSDAFRGTAFQNRSDGKDKACIAYYNLIPQFVNKLSKKYTGSVEVCYGDNCDYEKKIWLTDGENYLIGKVADGNLSTSDITNNASDFTNYLTCGQSINNINPVFDFYSENSERNFYAPADGVYALEAWGAQGMDCNTQRGGYGGYAYAEVSLKQGDKLYINVGGRGEGPVCNDGKVHAGGYNGGGKGNNGQSGGGGATSIAKQSGLINKPVLADYLFVVAGGGGGGTSNADKHGYSGGGYMDENSGATQSSAVYGGGGGTHGTGGGYYGSSQGSDPYWRSNGGSGYIGNPLNHNAVMYGYNVPQSSEVKTKTIATTNVSEIPTSNYAKMGEGFARITYIGNFTN